MCFTASVTAGMVVAGAAATIVTLRRREPAAIPLALGYFALMEALQLLGYGVADACASPANQTVTLLSYLHIVAQPFVINALAIALLARPVPPAWRAAAYGASALSAVVMLLQLYPFAWAGACQPGTVLCGEALCTITGTWHIGWTIPYNALLAPLDVVPGLGRGFPTYVIAAFVVPALYGAWRFALFHALAGPVFASVLTGNPNEMPAVWCLFSIGIILIALSPPFRRRFAGPPPPH